MLRCRWLYTIADQWSATQVGKHVSEPGNPHNDGPGQDVLMTPLLSVCPWGTKNLYRRQGGTDTPSRFFIKGIGFSSLCEPVWPGGKGARLVSRKTSVRSASALLSLQKLWLMDTVQPLTRFRTLRRKKIGRYVRRTTSLKKTTNLVLSLHAHNHPCLYCVEFTSSLCRTTLCRW